MAGRLSPLGIVTKWLLVPVSLAAIGYFIIGPRVGDKVLPPKAKELAQPGGTTGAQTASVTDTQPKTFTAPDVDVTVTPTANSQPPKKKKRRRRKKKPPVTVTAPETPAVTPSAPPAGNAPPAG